MPWLRAFLAELKRRRVYRVGAVYIVTALAVIEAADLVLPRLGLPDWSVTLVVVLALLGFPLALVLAWALEVSPEGVRRTGPAPGGSAAASARGLRVVTLAGAGIALLAGGAWWLFAGGGGSPGAPAIDRLAVLPLSNLMDDPEQEYFVQGMHDRLISELQQAGVSVIARTSVMAYGEGTRPVREIARELGVDAVVEGSVFRAGDSVEIEARLVDGTTEEYLWREAFGGSLRDVVRLHRDLTRAIAEEIRSALAPGERARLAAAPAVDPRAYEAHLKGVFRLHRNTAADLDAALGHFERALRFDSVYAPAYVGIAGVWGIRAQDGHVTAAEARQHWEPALERALALDPDLPEAHGAAAGFAAWADWDWERAVATYRRAIELNPGDAVARVLYGHLLSILGRWEEAEEQVEAARELDPLNPFVQALGATQLWLAGRHEDAVGILREVFRRDPNAGFGRNVLAAALHASGREEEAFEVWRKHYVLRGEEDVRTALDRGYEEGGYARAYRLAAEAMAAGASSGYKAAFDVADAWVRAGEPERAIPWFERALAERDQNMPYIGVLPILEPLHDDPRFRELARRVGVPVLEGPGSR